MTKPIKLGGLSIDPRDYASQGNAILGIRDSGKSYTATYLAERLMDAGIPITAFDPIGLWRFLRVGAKGKGYPVVVAGGEHGDLPLTPQSAPEIVRAAMREGVSLVIDLYSMDLSKADWKRIVAACVRVMLYENKQHGLRHVFIEEAAEFAPQRVGPDQGQVYAEMEKLGRMGGNALLGYTLINQRAEEVNKAVLELCDTLLLHRQKGKNSLAALSKWLDFAEVEDHKAISGSMPTLAQGECWAWVSGSVTPARVKIPEKNTFHPDRRAMRDGQAAVKDHKTVDVGAFVTQLSGSLAKHLEEAKANDPAELRKEIATLKRQMAQAVKQAILPDPQVLETARAEGRIEGERAAESNLKGQFADRCAALSSLLGVLNIDARNILAAPLALSSLTYKSTPSSPPARSSAFPKPASQVKPVAPLRQRMADADLGDLRGPERRILNALAELEALGVERAERVQVAFLAGYSHLNSKGFTNGMGALRSAELIDYPPEKGIVVLTEAGRSKADAAAAPRSSAELQDRIIRLLEGATARVLQPLIEAYPGDMAREDLTAASGYGHLNSKGFTNAMGRLRSLGFIDYPGTGRVVAKPVLFLEER